MSYSARARTDRPVLHRSPAKSPSLRMMWLRAVDMAKRAYPVLLVSLIFATALVATIALRLVIWLSIYRH